MSDFDDIDLAGLSDEDLIKQMHDDLYDGLKAEIEEGVHILLKRGWTPYKVLTVALVDGMKIVGDDGKTQLLRFEQCIIAAGSQPVKLPGFQESNGAAGTGPALTADDRTAVTSTTPTTTCPPRCRSDPHCTPHSCPRPTRSTDPPHTPMLCRSANLKA